MIAKAKKIFGNVTNVEEYTTNPLLLELNSLFAKLLEQPEGRNPVLCPRAIDINNKTSRESTLDPVAKRRKGRPKGSTAAKRFTSGGEVKKSKKAKVERE